MIDNGYTQKQAERVKVVRASKNRLNDIKNLKDNDITKLRYSLDDNGDCRTVLEFVAPGDHKQTFLQVVYISTNSTEQDIQDLLQEEQNSIDYEALAEILSKRFTVIKDRRRR